MMHNFKSVSKESVCIQYVLIHVEAHITQIHYL